MCLVYFSPAIMQNYSSVIADFKFFAFSCNNLSKFSFWGLVTFGWWLCWKWPFRPPDSESGLPLAFFGFYASFLATGEAWVLVGWSSECCWLWLSIQRGSDWKALEAKTAFPLAQVFFLTDGCALFLVGSPIGSNLCFVGGGAMAGTTFFTAKYYFLLIRSSVGLFICEGPDIKVAFFTDFEYFEILGRS